VTDHSLQLEILVDGTYRVADVLTRTAVHYTRGSESGDNDTEPAVAPLELDNPLNLWAPRSPASPFYGKLGVNTAARLTVDGSVRLAGYLADWVPRRPLKGTASTSVQLAGVLRRLGRGRDPLRPALERATLASGPVDYWSLGDGQQATTGANSVAEGAPAAATGSYSPPDFNRLDGALVPAGLAALPDFTNFGLLEATVRGTSTTSWRVEFVVCIVADSVDALTYLTTFRWYTGGGIQTWQLDVIQDSAEFHGYSPFLAGTPFFGTVYSLGSGIGHRLDDGQVHHVALEVTQTSGTVMAYSVYLDGALTDSGNNTTGALIGQQQVGAPRGWTANPTDISANNLLSVGSIGFWSPKPATPVDYAAVGAYSGELTTTRAARLCAEIGVTLTVTGTSENTMGPQTTAPILDQFDEIARTDDGRIFETRTVPGALTMRTGASILNQAAALTLSRNTGLLFPLEPVYSDKGLRNDVTATSPDGSSGRVSQDTGPRNTQDPTADPQGVTRYTSSWSVNPATGTALIDAAGWRVNLGTWDDVWYAAVTVSLDAAPGLTTAVNAVDIGDMITLTDLPPEEALDSVDLLVVGISEELPPKQRRVTFHCVAYGPYRVGILAATTGDVDPLVGHAESDSAVTAAAALAGAATFTVTASPLWTTDSDDFPQDVVVGGQRITITAVSGSSAPQTFTVTTAAGGRKINYAIPAGALVSCYQPLILAL
jgi:hypothetical protein